MKIFLINRSDVLLFSDDKKLKVGKENGREYIDAPVLPDGRIVLRAIRKPELANFILIMPLCPLLNTLLPYFALPC